MFPTLHLRRRSKWDHPTLLDHLWALSPLEALIARLYSFLLFFRGQPFYPPHNKPRIRVVCLSDTHDRIVSVPPGDLLIHAGDLTNSGTAADIQRQIDWLRGMPHRYKIVVCGNHDGWFDEAKRGMVDGSGDVVDLEGILFLQRTGVELTFFEGEEGRERKLKVWGAANIPRCGGDDVTFAYQYEPKHAEKVWKNTVPRDTEILVTHGPPFGHLDLNHLGCPALLSELWRVRPRLHVFGHVHCGAGREAVFFDEAQRARESLGARRKGGLARDLLPTGAWLDAIKVVFYGVNGVLWRWLMMGPGKVSSGSLLVNAGVMEGNTGRIRKVGACQVVDL